jgi:hypothetical protein
MNGRLRAEPDKYSTGGRQTIWLHGDDSERWYVSSPSEIATQLVKQINDKPYPLWPCYVVVCVGVGIGLLINGVFG